MAKREQSRLAVGFVALQSVRGLSAIAAVMFGAVSVYVYERFTVFTLLAVGVTIGFGTYAILGPCRAKTENALTAMRIDDPRIPGVLTVLFLLASAAAIFALRNAYYTKPITFYGGIAVAAGILTLRIFWTDAHLTNGLLAFLFGLQTFVTNQLAYPLGINGPDSGFHRRFARWIYEVGMVPGREVFSTQYTGFPLQHVLSASTAHLTGVGVEPAYRAVAILGMVLVLPLAYLVARQLGNREFAVLTVVIVASMEYVVYRAGYPSKLAYALPLLMLTFACAIYVYRRRGTPDIVLLFAVFGIALVFTHTHTAFVGLLLLVSLAIGNWLVPVLDPVIARISSFGARADGPEVRQDGIGRLDELKMTRQQRVRRKLRETTRTRLHILAFVFVVGFVAQSVYYADFYGNAVEILSQWINEVLLAEEIQVQETPRFQQFPTDSILLNTIGSGLLALLVTVGALDFLERRAKLELVLLTWLAGAGVVMVIGVIGDAQFALPNRIYVIAQLTAMAFFAADGGLYLLSQSERPPQQFAQVAAVCVAAVLVGFVFFSTASTIAGPETSPFNDDVPHRAWFGTTEQAAADAFIEGTADEEQYRFAGSFPVDEEMRLEYSDAEPGTVVSINEVRLQSGVGVRGGPGQIGGGIFVIPDEPRSGLVERSDRVYDNGAVELYQVREASPYDGSTTNDDIRSEEEVSR